MSKEIKEKCKECVYYNDKMEYPEVDGTTTHSNCMSIKCEYRKETKDTKIRRLTSKISDLEAKLAELREQITILDEENSKTFMKSVNAWRENAELKQQLAEKEKEFLQAVLA